MSIDIASSRRRYYIFVDCYNNIDFDILISYLNIHNFDRHIK